MALETIELTTEVLVVGSGAAGAMAAIKATAKGSSVLLATKGPYPSGDSSIALGGYGVALGNSDPRDNAQVHFEDITRVGEGLCNEKIVRAWTSKIIELTKEMDEWGVDLIKENGKFCQNPQEGYSYPRMVHHHKTSGATIMKCLGAKSKEMGFKILEHTTIGGLFRDQERITGAWGFQSQNGQLIFISAKTVIWATGGMGQLFPFTDNIKAITGEGYSIAFKAGAELTGMEFCHFLPTICYPQQMRTASVVIPSLKKLVVNGGARYYNNLGQRFMRQYFPREGDFINDNASLNEVIMRACSCEIYEGRGGPHGGVYLDVSDVPEEFWKKECMPLWEKATRAGINLTYQPLEILPYPHDMVGGVKINESGHSTIPGLFAGGEASGSAHGASRLPGSALSEAIANGAICGENAAKSAVSIKQPKITITQKQEVTEHLQKWLDKKTGVAPLEIRNRVQQIVNKYLNVAKEEKGLNKAVSELKEIETQLLPSMTAWNEEEKTRNIHISEAIEVEGQVELAKIIATASLIRKESRGELWGGFYRVDYPLRDDKNWLKNVVLKREQDGSISHYTEAPVKA